MLAREKAETQLGDERSREGDRSGSGVTSASAFAERI